MDKRLDELAQQKVIAEMTAVDKFEGAVEVVSQIYSRRGSLLAAVTAVLDACRDYIPAAQKIFEDFSEAATGYSNGKYKTLDDAFDLSRPSHWRQDKRNLELEHGFEIVEMVDDLCNEGAVKPDVFYQVGERFHKDGGVIKEVYYTARKVKRRYDEEVITLQGEVKSASDMRQARLRLEAVYETVTLMRAQEVDLDEALIAVAAALEEDVDHIKELYEMALSYRQSTIPASNSD